MYFAGNFARAPWLLLSLEREDQMSNTQSLPFPRVDPQVLDVIPAEESAPLPLPSQTSKDKDPEFDSYALKYSILQDPIEVENFERWKILYVVMWLPMLLVAIYVAVSHLFYLLVYRPQDSRRRLLGPAQMTYFFDKLTPLAATIRAGVTTSEALDALSAVPLVLAKPKNWREWVVWFWLNQPDAQGPRNRLRLTFKLVLEELGQLYAAGRGRTWQDPIRVVSLACGSAHATIEALACFLSKCPTAHVRLTLVDLNDISLGKAWRLAQKRNIAYCVKVVKQNLVKFVSSAREESWDIIEMVGFLDYRRAKSLVRLCTKIRSMLKSHTGLFVTAHINPSPWSLVVRWVTNWPGLRRRWPRTFKKLLIQSQFKDSEISIIVEPSLTHTVAWCRKRG